MSADWDGIAQQLATEHKQRRDEIARRRELILSHPDLAARLTEAPLGYAKPEQWNGYIPPELWNGVRNDSPRRAALVEILAEAEGRTS